MAEKIKLLELDIDTDSIIARSVQLKKDLDEVRASLAELKKSGDTSSETFIKQSAEAAKLSAEYNLNQRQLTNLVATKGNFTTATEKANAVLAIEANSVADARLQNKELLAIRNELNLKTPAGVAAAEKLNQKIDQNTQFIRENVSAMEQQKMDIGRYGIALEGVDSILANFGVNGVQARNVVQGFTQIVATGAGDVTSYASGLATATKAKLGFKTASQAAAEAQAATNVASAAGVAGNAALASSQAGVTTATAAGTMGLRAFALALAATGIGVIVIGLALLFNHLRKIDPVIDAVEQGFAAIGAVIDVVSKAIFSLDFEGLGDKMMDAAQAAIELKEAQQDLEDVMKNQEILNAKASNAYDLLIIKSKNRTLSEQQRLEFLKQAEKIETENFNQRMAQSNEELRQANQSIIIKAQLTEQEIKLLQKKGFVYAMQLQSSGRITEEETDVLKKALLSREQMIGESNKRLEKRQNAEDKLEENRQKAAEEARQKAQKAADDAAQKRQEQLNRAAAIAKSQLDLFISEQGTRARSMQEEIKLSEQILAKKLALYQKEFEASKKGEEDRNALLVKQNTAREEQLQKQVELTTAYAKAELDLFVAQNTSRIQSEQMLTQALVDEEETRLQNIANKKLAQLELEKQTNQATIDAKVAANQQLTEVDLQFLTEKLAIEAELKAQARANEEALEAQIKEQKAAQLAADKEIALAEAATQLEMDLIAAQQQYDLELEQLNAALAKQELTKEQYRKLEIQANNKKNELIQAAQLKSDQRNLAGLQALGNGMEELFGKSKALSLAMAMINGAQAITSILAQYPKFDGGFAMAAAIISATATTVAQVAKISSTKLKDGAVDIDGPGTSTSDSIPAMLSKGESVINAKATAQFKPLLQAINAGVGLNYLESNMQYPTIYTSTSNATNNNMVIDYDLLAAKIGDRVGASVVEGNKTLPAPTLAIETFERERSSYDNIIKGANH